MGTVLLGINPFGTFVTTVVTRTLEGFLTGLIFKGLHSINGVKKFSYYIARLCCPLLNTLLFMSSLVLFFYNTDYVQAFVTALGAKNPLIFVVLFVGVQGLIEAGICFIVASVRKSSNSGVASLFARLSFKKKSRADIVKLVASGDLVPAQLVQIKSAIEKGLTESQLVELINNNISAEKMKEIIEIAVLENSMAD